jgi:hypothetical protein
MRAAVGLAWRGAAMFAFGATAALAVTLNRPAAPPAALTAAARPQPAPTCATAGLTVSLAKAAGAFGSLYHVDFTNTSRSTCTLGGYPQVAAYAVSRSGYAQVGNAALREVADGASRVLLRPGGTAHWDVDITAVARDVACRPVAAAGLRVVPPGASKPRYLRTHLTACSATGPDARVYLRLRAIQPGAGSTANPRSAANSRSARGRHRHAGPGRIVALA